MKEYDLVDQYLTYATKPDPSTADRRILIRGSINTIINDSERVGSREGFTLLGSAGISGVENESGFDWNTSTETNIHGRASGDDLEIFIESIGDREFNSWQTLADGFSAVDFVFDTYWDNTEKIDRLIFCNGTDDAFDFSGAMATFASATTNTITIEGTLTAAQRRFLTTGTRQFRIKDTGGTWRTFTYTGGESTQTLTGVTGDPTLFTFAVGAPIFQAVITRSNLVAANYLIDQLRVINNHLHVSSRSDRRVFVSQNDNIADFTFSTPRIAGEGALFTLDQSSRAIRALRENPIYMTEDYIYKAEFREITVSTTLTEAATCKRLKTANGQGAIHHDLTAEIENGIGYISKDKTLLVLEDAENTSQPLISNLSDLIKPDFDAANFTGGKMLKHKNRLYISLPAESRVYIHEKRLKLDGSVVSFWQPPQTFPVGPLAIIDDEIHGHSAIASETYKLFDGLNDNGNPVTARACLAKYNGGKQGRLKTMDEIMSIGYISPNTVIDVMVILEKDQGESSVLDQQISGSDDRIVYNSDEEEDPSLGTNSLGDESLSGDNLDEVLPKFRVIHELNTDDFFDYEIRYETNEIDQDWELLATGPNAMISKSHASGIKQ